MMRQSSTQQSIKQLASLPTAQGGLSRLAANRVRRAGIKLEPLLSRAGLTIDQIDDPEQRIDAGNQIAFLEVAAEALNDEFLGLSLAEEVDCRDLRIAVLRHGIFRHARRCVEARFPLQPHH